MREANPVPDEVHSSHPDFEPDPLILRNPSRPVGLAIER
jgi:hypothetical protein